MYEEALSVKVSKLIKRRPALENLIVLCYKLTSSAFINSTKNFIPMLEYKQILNFFFAYFFNDIILLSFSVVSRKKLAAELKKKNDLSLLIVVEGNILCLICINQFLDYLPALARVGIRKKIQINRFINLKYLVRPLRNTFFYLWLIFLAIALIR